MTERLPATPTGIAEAARLLAQGRIVAFPTDTVYGVAVAASHRDRLPALFDLKRRPLDRRIPMLVGGRHQISTDEWSVDERAHRLMERFWPGPLTLVLPARAEGETQGFRAPDHPVALELIHAAGPLLATSANISDQPDTLSADDVVVAFATRQPELAAVVDGGRVPGGVASTVVDLSAMPARVLRDGPIGRSELATVIDLGA